MLHLSPPIYSNPNEFSPRYANFDIITIMKNLLNFNPYFRMTAFEVIHLEVFDDVRDHVKESALVKMR